MGAVMNNDTRLNVDTKAEESHELLQGLNEAKRVGLVVCTSGDRRVVTSWALTETAAETMEPILRVHSPARVINPRANLALQDM